MFGHLPVTVALLLQCPSTELSKAAPSTGLVKKSLTPSFIALYCQWNVAAPGDEDDRYSASFGLKLCLQFNTRYAWHTNVSNQTFGLVSGSGIQELLCAVEAERGHPRGFDQILQCALNRLVVVKNPKVPE
jgi:hypothetical protein